eukprot:2746120-Rhodomonas_salina.1
MSVCVLCAELKSEIEFHKKPNSKKVKGKFTGVGRLEEELGEAVELVESEQRSRFTKPRIIFGINEIKDKKSGGGRKFGAMLRTEIGWWHVRWDVECPCTEIACLPSTSPRTEMDCRATISPHSCTETSYHTASSCTETGCHTASSCTEPGCRATRRKAEDKTKAIKETFRKEEVR